MKTLMLTSASILALFAGPALAQDNTGNQTGKMNSNGDCVCPQGNMQGMHENMRQNMQGNMPRGMRKDMNSRVRSEGGYGQLNPEPGNTSSASSGSNEPSEQEIANRYERMMENLNEDDGSQNAGNSQNRQNSQSAQNNPNSGSQDLGPVWNELREYNQSDRSNDTSGNGGQNQRQNQAQNQDQNLDGEPLWDDIGNAQSDPSDAGPVPGFDEDDSGRKMTTVDPSRPGVYDDGPVREEANPDVDGQTSASAGDQSANEGNGAMMPQDETMIEKRRYGDRDNRGKSQDRVQRGDEQSGQSANQGQNRQMRRNMQLNAQNAARLASAFLPDVTFNKWRIDRENNTFAIEVSGTHDSTGETYMVDVTPNGRIEEVEQVIPLSRVPREVRRAAGEVVSGMLVREVKRSMRPDMEMYYEFRGRLANGENAHLSIRHDGRFINLNTM